MILLKTALEYHRRGWCIIPIVAGTKVPPKGLRWKQYQAERPDEATVRRWFANGKASGLAVIFGEVSGGLVCRDFDDMASYERWAKEYPDLAKTLPTVATSRGRHVYARADQQDVARLRASLGKSDGKASIKCGDGELLASTGCHALLPPSPHPDGPRYRWIVPLGDEIPTIELESSGFLPCNREDREVRENRRGQREPKTLRGESDAATTAPLACPGDTLISLDSGDSLLHRQIEEAIARTLPTGTRQRHRLLFELARELKAIPGLADAPAQALKPIVRQWPESTSSQGAAAGGVVPGIAAGVRRRAVFPIDPDRRRAGGRQSCYGIPLAAGLEDRRDSQAGVDGKLRGPSGEPVSLSGAIVIFQEFYLTNGKQCR